MPIASLSLASKGITPHLAAIWRGPLVRKFLYLITALIVLAIAGSLAFRLYGPQIMRYAMVPRVEFKALPAPAPNAYTDEKLWLARPDMAKGSPALWVPEGFKPGANPKAAVFYIHPTSYIEPLPKSWNASLDDAETNDRAALFVRGQASAFNEVGQIWAPRYRQAAFGAFLTDKAESQKALDLAYADISIAFDQFMKEVGPDRPIILAGHSQGALHMMRLLTEKVAGQPAAKRIVAAYVIGWPISRTADLPKLGLPECERADQTGCILSWQSFAEPADPAQLLEIYDASIGLTGQSRKGTAMVCTNPITGTRGGRAPAKTNLGTLVEADDLKSAKLVKAAVPARCGEGGFLMIGNAPEIGSYVLPGNNYHVYDFSLFWANIRADAARRFAAFGGK